MRLRLERRARPSVAMRWATPGLAVLLAMASGALLFQAIGVNGAAAVYEIFLSPLLDPRSWQDLVVKASPLILIAVGLSIGFRANVWNIGAEGQYVMGGLGATGVALWTLDGSGGLWVLPSMMAAGAAGGAAWAAAAAFLRARFGVSEILSSLMLVYVAIQLLNYLMRGPWKDPAGFNFPQSPLFADFQILPTVVPGTVVHLGAPIALALAVIAALVLKKTVFGFGMRLTGAAPAAARFAGFAPNGAVWAAMLISGAAAGLAGAFEASGGFGQMMPQFPQGYGFTAIIVAFLGRLDPLGAAPAGLIVAVTIVGGEAAQTALSLPSSATAVFQAMTLFFLLATDLLTTHRLRVERDDAGAGA